MLQQRLIGYQLVARTNDADIAMLDATRLLMGLDPLTEEPKAFTAPLNEDRTVSVATPLQVQKKEIDTSIVLAGFSSDLVAAFLAGYNDEADILAGLKTLNVAKASIDSDIGFVGEKSASIPILLSESKDSSDLYSIGVVNDHWIPLVAPVVTPKFFTYSEKMLIAWWDVINALAIELKGKNSHSGTDIALDVEKLKVLADARLLTITRLYARIEKTPENIGYMSAVESAKLSLSDARSLSDMASIGTALDASVPQLPMIRRRWRYGA